MKENTGKLKRWVHALRGTQIQEPEKGGEGIFWTDQKTGEKLGVWSD